MSFEEEVRAEAERRQEDYDEHSVDYDLEVEAFVHGALWARSTLFGVVEAVRAEHVEVAAADSTYCSADAERWPCPTIRVLTDRLGDD